MSTVYRWLFVAWVLVCSDVFADADPFGEDWPAGPNRELTGGFCGSCHSLDLIKQQRQSREGWDKLMTWMSETQNMPVVSPEVRVMLLDYLELNFGLDVEAAVAGEGLLDSPGGLQGVRLPPLLDEE
ncbi:MAG: hypothetical protein AAFR91_03765 [Pseudomonadota bacterium]